MPPLSLGWRKSTAACSLKLCWKVNKAMKHSGFYNQFFYHVEVACVFVDSLLQQIHLSKINLFCFNCWSTKSSWLSCHSVNDQRLDIIFTENEFFLRKSSWKIIINKQAVEDNCVRCPHTLFNLILQYNSISIMTIVTRSPKACRSILA